MKNGKKIFWVLTVLNIILAIIDGLLTYISTPDLALESNPLVAIFGLGWGILFMANLIILPLIAAFTYYTFVIYQQPLIPYRTYRRYSSQLFYQRPDRFRRMFYWFPKNWRAAAAMIGFAIGITAPVNRLIIVLEWVGHITESSWYYRYNAFRRMIPYRFDILVAAILIVLLFIYWRILYYKKNVHLLAKTEYIETDRKYTLTNRVADILLFILSVFPATVFIGLFQYVLYFVLIIKGIKFILNKKKKKGSDRELI